MDFIIFQVTNSLEQHEMNGILSPKKDELTQPQVPEKTVEKAGLLASMLLEKKESQQPQQPANITTMVKF